MLAWLVCTEPERLNVFVVVVGLQDENGLVTKEKFNQACDDHPVLLTVFSRLFGRADDPRKFTRRTAAQQQAAQALSNIKVRPCVNPGYSHTVPC